MKSLIKSLAPVVFLFLFMACSSSRKISSSKNTNKNKVDNLSDANSKSGNTASPTKKGDLESTNLNADVNIPPQIVAESFNKSFPEVYNASWSIPIGMATPRKNGWSLYTANFHMNDIKHSITYTEKGDLFETREEIKPEQLPPSVHNTIKAKYPNGSILSTSSVKNSKVIGSYFVILRPEFDATIIELMFTEDGKITK